jgi:hypothetical protein
MSSAEPYPRVVGAADGELFLLGGSNSVGDLFSPAGFQRRVPIPHWAALMARRAAFFDQQGLTWRLIIAPEKLSVYGMDLLPGLIDGPATAPGENFIRHMGAGHADHIVYPRAQLCDAARQVRVYPRTDSHWNAEGAFVAFQAAMRSAEIAFDPAELRGLPVRELHYRGDLWPAERSEGSETFLRPEVPAKIRRAYCGPVLGLKEAIKGRSHAGLHHGSHCILYNQAPQIDERVVLFGSSFSESGPEGGYLTFLFSLFFREVHFIWSNNLDYGYVVRQRPDRVFIEMPERFPTMCPADDFDVEAYGAAVARKWHAANDAVPSPEAGSLDALLQPDVMASGLTPEWIASAYVMMLGRLPENRQIIDFWLRKDLTVAELRRAFLTSPEFDVILRNQRR